MNDSDLESRLKQVSLPERSQDYWADFPSRVRVQLHQEQPKLAPQNVWRPRPAWAGGFALALALVFVGVQFHPLKAASVAISTHERHLHAQLAQLDAGLHVLMFNPHGMGYLLAEAN